jgi:glycosyltransferase involved in cell wall biosynthesis
VDLVRRKLEALARQTTGAAAIEVVLVDNACPDRVGERMAAEAWPFALRVLRSERRLNAADGRAWAAREARGRWLWWSDDDVVPADDALAAHLAVQARRPGVTVGSVRFVTERDTRRWRPRRSGPAHFTGVNVVFPRAAWQRVADDLLPLPRPYGGEDTALALALQADGVPFSDARDAWVDHHGPVPASGGDPRKGFDAGYNAALLDRRYPRAAWSLGVHPLEMLAKRILFSPLWCALTANTPRGRFEHAYFLGAREALRGGSEGPS